MKPPLCRRFALAPNSVSAIKDVATLLVETRYNAAFGSKPAKRRSKQYMSPSKPSPVPDIGSTTMTDRALAHYKERFLPQYTRILGEIQGTEMTVLIWGPGPSGGDLYQKRLQIRDELRVKGVTALFSEEVPIAASEDEHSLSGQELAQAKASDLIVAIQCSFGSTAEVHDFGRLASTIAHKLLVFIDQDALTGYSYQGLLKSGLRGIVWVKNPDFEPATCLPMAPGKGPTATETPRQCHDA